MRSSRYLQAQRRTRRQVLKSSAAASLGVFLAACGSKSNAASTPATQAAQTKTAPDATVTPVAPATDSPVAPVATDSATVVTAAVAPPAGNTFNEAHQLRSSVNYVAESSGRRILNPYVAVWVEDTNGILIHTVGISVQLGKGLKWLNDLKRWYKSDQARIDGGGDDTLETISSATRAPGVHEFIWDGRDAAGALVPLGQYKLFFEAAQEKGPYNFVEYDLILDGQPFVTNLEPAAQLQEMLVTVEAR